MRGSLKVKQTYDHLKENGDVAALSGGGGGSNARNPHDFDIKLLQAKRQQAEMKRLVPHTQLIDEPCVCVRNTVINAHRNTPVLYS